MKEITIIGNLGSNAVLRQTSDGRSLMTFSVAVNHGQNETTWFNCIGNYREKVFPYLQKGVQVCVIGDFSASIWQGKIDITINVDKMELCGTKSNDPTPTPPSEIAVTDMEGNQVED